MTKYRKNLRLKNYDYASDGYYFLSFNTYYHLPYFKSPAARKIIKKKVKQMPDYFSGVSLDTYTIAPSHLHLILILLKSKKTVSKIVQALRSWITRELRKINPRLKGKPIWQPNFYEHVIRNEKALEKIREYIVNHPYKENVPIVEIYRGL